MVLDQLEKISFHLLSIASLNNITQSFIPFDHVLKTGNYLEVKGQIYYRRIF